MKLWPFKKKVIKVEEEKGIEVETVVIHSDDSGMHRAEVAMRHAGFCINDTLYNQLPWIAQVFDKYKKLDQQEALHKDVFVDDRDGV